MIKRLLVKNNVLFWRLASMVSLMIPNVICLESGKVYYLINGFVVESNPYNFIISFVHLRQKTEITIELEPEFIAPKQLVLTEQLFEQ